VAVADQQRTICSLQRNCALQFTSCAPRSYVACRVWGWDSAKLQCANACSFFNGGAAPNGKRPQRGEAVFRWGLCREAPRQDSLNLKSGRRSSESSGRIYAKASTFAGRRILIEPPPPWIIAHRAGFFCRGEVRSRGIMAQTPQAQLRAEEHSA
jgi:hypothetical protein